MDCSGWSRSTCIKVSSPRYKASKVACCEASKFSLTKVFISAKFALIVDETDKDSRNEVHEFQMPLMVLSCSSVSP